MPACIGYFADTVDRRYNVHRRAAAVGRGRRRGITQPPIRRRRRG